MTKTKLILRGFWTILPIVGIAVSALILENVPMSIFWAACILDTQLVSQGDRIVAAIRASSARVDKPFYATRRAARPFRDGGAA